MLSSLRCFFYFEDIKISTEVQQEVSVPANYSLLVNFVVLDVSTTLHQEDATDLVQVYVYIINPGQLFQPRSVLIANLKNMSPHVVTKVAFDIGNLTFRCVGGTAVVHISGEWKKSPPIFGKVVTETASIDTSSSDSSLFSTESSKSSDSYENAFKQMIPMNHTTMPPAVKRRRVSKKKIKVKKEKRDHKKN